VFDDALPAARVVVDASPVGAVVFDDLSPVVLDSSPVVFDASLVAAVEDDVFCIHRPARVQPGQPMPDEEFFIDEAIQTKESQQLDVSPGLCWDQFFMDVMSASKESPQGVSLAKPTTPLAPLPRPASPLEFWRTHVLWKLYSQSQKTTDHRPPRPTKLPLTRADVGRVFGLPAADSPSSFLVLEPPFVRWHVQPLAPLWASSPATNEAVLPWKQLSVRSSQARLSSRSSASSQGSLWRENTPLARKLTLRTEGCGLWA
ncbi:unnamed protein product, partial [Polarella glacialis]